MTSRLDERFEKFSSVVDTAFLVLFAGLFMWAVAEWAGLIPDAFQPVRSLCITGGMLVMGIAPFARRRSKMAFYVSLAISMALMGLSLFVRR